MPKLTHTLGPDEAIKRVWARVSSPFLALILPLDRLAIVAQRHLDRRFVTAAGVMISAGKRRGGGRAFDYLQAEYHSRHSQWTAALENLSSLAPESPSSAYHLRADILTRLKRLREAHDSLLGRTDRGAAERRLHLALRLRDEPAIAHALGWSADDPGQPRYGLVRGVVDDRYFRHFMSSSARRSLATIAKALPDAAKLSLALHLILADRPISADTVLSTVPTDEDLPDNEAILRALIHRLRSGSKPTPQIIAVLDTHDGQYLYTTLSNFLPHASRIEALVRAGLSGTLRDMIDKARNSAPAGTSQLEALLGMGGSDDVGVADALRVLSELYPDENIFPEVLDRFRRQNEVTSVDDVKVFMKRWAWMDLNPDLSQAFRDVAMSDSERAEAAIRTQMMLRRFKAADDLLERALLQFPSRFALHRLGVQRAAAREHSTDIDNLLMRANTRFSNPTDQLILLIDAESYDTADQRLDTISPSSLSSTQLDYVLNSLLTRGHIGRALVLSRSTRNHLSSSMKTQLESATKAIHTLQTNGLCGVSAEDFQSPQDLFPAIRALTAKPKSAKTAITLVTSTLRPGGAERQLSATATGLSDILPVRILCRSLDPGIDADFFLERLETCGLTVREFDSAVSQDKIPAQLDPILALLPPELSEFTAPIYLDIKQHPPTVLHLWQDRACLGGTLAALVTGCPKIVMSLRSTRPDARRRYRPYQPDMFRFLLNEFADRVIAVNNSDYGARDYEAWLDLPNGTIKTVRNGFDLASIRARADAAPSVRDSLGIPAGAPVLGWVGRFTFEKRPKLWTDVAITLCNRLPELHAIAAGDGAMREAMQQRVDAAGLSHRIHFTGIQRPIEPYMALMTVLMLTSEREGLPNVLIEAQVLGVPVISTDAGGASEAFDDERSGLLVQPETVSALADTAASLISDTDRLNQMSDYARTWAETTFALPRMIRDTLDAYGVKQSGSQIH